MRWFGGRSVLTLAGVAALLTTAAGHAQAPEPVAAGPSLPARLSLPPLYPGERLRIAWPIAPVRFTFSEVMPIGLGFARGPTEYFVAESVWLEAGPLSLRTRTSSAEAIELDCTSYTCVPVREVALTTEARLDLGALGRSSVLPESYLFARAQHYANKAGGFVRPGASRLQLGWGGLLGF